jgi:hypothetical protein
MSELIIKDEPEKVFLPCRNFQLNMSMLDYGVAEKKFQMDWSKLSYGNEQMLDFLLNKEEQRLPSRYYNYFFQKPSRRSDMEKHFLKEKGFQIENGEESEEGDELDKRLTIMYLEQTKELKD